MDCQAVRGKINLYIDGVLSSADSEPFLVHVGSCQDCKRELDNMMRLHRALRSLGDVEPPLGLADAAARKARKRRGMPIAYISVGVAAALAFALVLTNVVLPRYNYSTDQAVPESYMMAAPADEWQSISGTGEAAEGAVEAPAPAPRQAADAETDRSDALFSDTPEAPAEDEAPESGELLQEDQMFIMTAPAPSCIVTVAADDERQTGVRAALESIIAEYGIEAIFLSDDVMDTISFVLPEAALEDITVLTADFIPEDEITVNALIEFRFIK
jgi:hypothetical protein